MKKLFKIFVSWIGIQYYKYNSKYEIDSVSLDTYWLLNEMGYIEGGEVPTVCEVQTLLRKQGIHIVILTRSWSDENPIMWSWYVEILHPEHIRNVDLDDRDNDDPYDSYDQALRKAIYCSLEYLKSKL